MKLSLTAIAALFAAFFHPTVATGTRAASSTITEEKPGRNLDAIDAAIKAFKAFDLDEIVGVNGDEVLDAKLEGKIEATLVKLEAMTFLQVLAGNRLANCILSNWGVDGFIEVTWIRGILGEFGDSFPSDNQDRNADGKLSETDLTIGFTIMGQDDIKEWLMILGCDHS